MLPFGGLVRGLRLPPLADRCRLANGTPPTRGWEGRRRHGTPRRSRVGGWSCKRSNTAQPQSMLGPAEQVGGTDAVRAIQRWKFARSWPRPRPAPARVTGWHCRGPRPHSDGEGRGRASSAYSINAVPWLRAIAYAAPRSGRARLVARHERLTRAQCDPRQYLRRYGQARPVLRPGLAAMAPNRRAGCGAVRHPYGDNRPTRLGVPVQCEWADIRGPAATVRTAAA
jgi:hypothetical protein